MTEQKGIDENQKRKNDVSLIELYRSILLDAKKNKHNF